MIYSPQAWRRSRDLLVPPPHPPRAESYRHWPLEDLLEAIAHHHTVSGSPEAAVSAMSGLALALLLRPNQPEEKKPCPTTPTDRAQSST